MGAISRAVWAREVGIWPHATGTFEAAHKLETVTITSYEESGRSHSFDLLSVCRLQQSTVSFGLPNCTFFLYAA